MDVFSKRPLFGLLLVCAAVCAVACSTKPPPAAPAEERPPVEAVQAAEKSEISEHLEIPEASALTPPTTTPLPDIALQSADVDPDPKDGSAKNSKPAAPPKEAPTDAEPAPAKDEKQSVRGRQILRVNHMLDRLEIREVFKFDGTLADAPFEGQEPSAIYNAHRLQPSDGKSLGFGLQVWKLPSGSRALEQFEALFSQSVGGVKTKDAGDRSFRVEHHKLRSLVFLDQRFQAVAWLTCDEKLCSYEQLVQYAQRIRKRF